MLTNPYYKGIVTLNRAQHAGSHEPLVTAKIWDTVQRLLTSRRQGERSRIHTHYLKSTVSCFTADAGCWSTTLGRRAGACTTTSSARAARTAHHEANIPWDTPVTPLSRVFPRHRAVRPPPAAIAEYVGGRP